MALKFKRKKDGYYLYLTHKGTTYVIKDERWFPARQWVAGWVADILTQDVMKEYDELEMKYSPPSWDNA